jgi:hypothetical protein
LALVWRELISCALCERRELQNKLFCITGGHQRRLTALLVGNSK